MHVCMHIRSSALRLQAPVVGSHLHTHVSLDGLSHSLQLHLRHRLCTHARLGGLSHNLRAEQWFCWDEAEVLHVHGYMRVGSCV